MRPSFVRHLIIAVSVMMSILLYLDRLCVGFLQTYMREDLGLTSLQMDVFIGVFFYSYAIGQVPAGFLSDRFGPRRMLAIYILSWSVFTALMGIANGFPLLIIMRLGCGLGQAGAYPACGTLLSRWVPLASRGISSGIVVLGGRLGALLAPILTAFLLVAFIPPATTPLVSTGDLLDVASLRTKLVPDRRQNPPKWTTAHGEAVARLMPPQSLEQIERASDSDQAKEPIVTALNALVVDPNLPTAVDPGDIKNPFAKLNFEREVFSQLTARTKGKTFSEAESLRLNRLILEGALPELRKFYGAGWRPVLFVYGSAGIVVAGIFWFFFRDRPSEHPWCNQAEQELISAGAVAPVAAPTTKAGLPLRYLITNRTLWLSSVSQFMTNLAWLFTVTHVPRYLLEVHQVPTMTRSMMTAVPAFGGIAGMYLGGWLTDVLTRRVGLRWGRALPMGLTRFAAAAAYVACILLKSPWEVTIALTFVFFFVDLGVSATWAFCQDVGGRHVGSVLGWGNMWGNFGAAVAPVVYGLCMDLMTTAQSSPTGKPFSDFAHMVFPNATGYSNVAPWNLTFGVCAVAFMISGLSALAVDSTKQIVPEESVVRS